MMAALAALVVLVVFVAGCLVGMHYAVKHDAIAAIRTAQKLGIAPIAWVKATLDDGEEQTAARRARRGRA